MSKETKDTLWGLLIASVTSTGCGIALGVVNK